VTVFGKGLGLEQINRGFMKAQLKRYQGDDFEDIEWTPYNVT
jgi:hypothetical protein